MFSVVHFPREERETGGVSAAQLRSQHTKRANACFPVSVLFLIRRCDSAEIIGEEVDFEIYYNSSKILVVRFWGGGHHKEQAKAAAIDRSIDLYGCPLAGGLGLLHQLFD